MVGERTGVSVLASAPVLMVAVERDGDVRDIHLHAGGQGFWVARMSACLGAPTTLVAALGGESGVALRALIESEGVSVHAIEVSRPSAVWISDDAEGEGATVAELGPPALTRHESDELANAVLGHGLTSRVTILTGGPPGVLGPERYGRLAHDLRALGATVVADPAIEQLTAACEGGIHLVKVAHDELIEAGMAAGDRPEELVEAALALRGRGAGTVVVSRAAEPLLAALDDDRIIEVTTPTLEAVNHRGAGDSVTGATAAALADGAPIEEALRLAAAAGALNVTRQGLGSGDAGAIRRLAQEVRVRELAASRPTGG